MIGRGRGNSAAASDREHDRPTVNIESLSPDALWEAAVIDHPCPSESETGQIDDQNRKVNVEGFVVRQRGKTALLCGMPLLHLHHSHCAV